MIQSEGPSWAKQFTWARFSEAVVQAIVDCANTIDGAELVREKIRGFSSDARLIKH